jgi:hypothetical protein
MTLTKKYQSIQLIGFDCRMTTFRNNLAFYGFPMSNGMILGLSGCFTFVYSNLKNNRIPFYTVAGITDQTLEGLSSVFDTYIIKGKYSFDDKNIIKSLKQKLNKNIPVNVAINRPFLEHIRLGRKKEDYVIEFSNIGFHYVTITEIIEDSITFFETDYTLPITFDIETFMELWFFDDFHKRFVIDPPQRCDGKFYTILPPKINANNDKKTINYSINKVVLSFFSEGGDIYHGEKGLSTFFEEINNWENEASTECIERSILFLKFLEKYLSGGGFGRRMYSYFLAEISSEMDDKNLKDIAIMFKETSKLWANFINEISHIKVIDSIRKKEFHAFKSIIHLYSDMIKTSEKQQFKSLKNWVDSKP